jgi:ribosomal protein L29
MPRSKVDLLTFGQPEAGTPSQLRNSISEHEYDKVKDRKLTGTNARRLQHIAQRCSEWAAWRGTSDVQTPMLAAATLSVEQLIAFLEDVTGEVCNITHREPIRWVPIRSDDGEVDWRSDLLVLLDAVERIRPVVAGQEEVDSIGFPDEYVTSWRTGSFEEFGYVHRALGEEFTALMTSWHKLPSDTRILARLQDAAKKVYCDLKATVQTASEHNPESLNEYRRQVARAISEARTLSMARKTRYWHWCSATQKIADALDAWMSKPWIDGWEHSQNQSIRKQLRRDVAFLRQYAILMRATSLRFRMLLRLDALFALVRRINARVTQQFGPVKTRCPADIDKLFKVDLVEPEWRQRWSSSLGPKMKGVRKLIALVTKINQQQRPWLVGTFLEEFVHAGLVGGTNQENQRRGIVEGWLVPMQSVGLAAQVSWSDLFAVPSEPTTTQNDGPVKRDWEATMAKDYNHARAWIVNPFGAR